MIVEFIGTPGAGKTSLLPVVRQHFTARGFQAYSVVEAARPFAERTPAGKLIPHWLPQRARKLLLWQVFYQSSRLYRRRFSAEHQEMIERVLTFQAQRPISPADKNHVLGWFIHLTGCYEFFRAYATPRDVLLFDEGFIHRVVQLFASENETPDPRQVTAYLELVPRPDLVVFPNAPRELCETRVYERGLWERFRAKTPQETSRFIANASSVVHLAVDWMQAQGWPVIEVNNGAQEMSVSRETLRQTLLRSSFSKLSIEPA